MNAREIQELLDREPFQPFRVKLSRGDQYDIRDPNLAIAMRSQFFLAWPRSDRWTFVPYLHVAAVENLPNGGSQRDGRRRG